MASTCSRATWRRRAKSTPWFSISSRFQPKPTPKVKRPADTVSRLATALAVASGSCWATRQMPVPTRRRSVTEAAAARATKGSRHRRYCSGSSASPVGGGVSRLVGMWVCSGTHRESKPRSSAARASSATAMERSVAKMVTP